MNSYSQITFDFTEEQLTGHSLPSVGFRVKSMKPADPQVQPQSAIPEPSPVQEEKKAAPATPEKSTRGRKALKEFDAEADLIHIPEDEILFQRQYYSIGEVSGMFNVNPSLLRFWESEFNIIQPRKNRKGDRHFRPVDIKNLQLIYDLLRRRKLTIEGAKEFLKNSKKPKESFEMIQSLQKIRSFLLELKTSL